MKTKVFTMFLSLGFGTMLLAQVPDTIQVKPDTTRTFTISNPQNVATFNWSITGNAHTGTPTLGTDATTGNITFTSTSGNISTLSVIPVSSQNCQGDAKQIILKVTSAMTFLASIANADSHVCPLSTNNPTGGRMSATVTVTGATGVSASNPITLSYSLNGTPLTTPITMNSASQVVQFDLVSVTPGAVTVQITGIKFGKVVSASSATVNTTLDNLPTVDNIF